MKSAALLLALGGVAANEVNPIEKVIQMMGDLEAKIIGEGKAAQKTYDDFAEFCEDRSKNLGFEIKTGKANIAELQATIVDETANLDALAAKVDDLGGSIAANEADLKAATDVRNKENADFLAEQKELTSVIDMLQRAIAILERELGGGASMLQLKDAKSVTEALTILVKGAFISNADAKQLTALVQTNNDDDDTGAPDAAVYENHSGGIIDTLNNLLGTAEGQLDSATKAETQAQNAYDMLKQSLSDEIKYANQDMDEAKKNSDESSENKAAAQGDLGVSTKDLNQDVGDLGSLHADCMAKAEDFEAETTSRGEELKALAMAKKAVADNAGGASGQQYGFLQIASSSDLKSFEVVRRIKDLAHANKAPELAQLASRMNSVIRLSNGDDVFTKIKSMITDMIGKLEKEAAEAAELKEWCDKEIAEATAKKEDATSIVEKLSTKIDRKSAASAKLKEEVATAQQELAELASTGATMDELRAEEKSTFEHNHPEMEAGLKGVKLALKILNEYYAKAGESGAGGGIIGMLEVIESDFTKTITEMVEAERTAAAMFDQQSKENAVTKTTKDQDVKYKTKEAAALDKAVQELTSDRSGVQEELDATLDYLKSLDDKCTYKVESYAERKARREAEVNGLKEALDILENETAFVQTGRFLRGVRKH